METAGQASVAKVRGGLHPARPCARHSPQRGGVPGLRGFIRCCTEPRKGSGSQWVSFSECDICKTVSKDREVQNGSARGRLCGVPCGGGPLFSGQDPETESINSLFSKILILLSLPNWRCSIVAIPGSWRQLPALRRPRCPSTPSRSTLWTVGSRYDDWNWSPRPGPSSWPRTTRP